MKIVINLILLLIFTGCNCDPVPTFPYFDKVEEGKVRRTDVMYNGKQYHALTHKEYKRVLSELITLRNRVNTQIALMLPFMKKSEVNE